MSIASEITRLQGAKADLATAIEGKGVTVPSATKLDGYADLVDAISQGGGGGTMQSKSVSYTPSTSAQSQAVTADAGYDGLSSVAVSVAAMPSGTEGTPTATKGTVSNHSIAVTPSVTNSAGYIEGGTKTGEAVTVSASDVTSGYQIKTANGTYDVTNLASLIVAVPNTYTASDEGKVVSNGALVAQTAHADVTPTTSDQTIDTTTNNSIKVKGDADLVAGNIKKDVEIFGVTGSYEGSGGSDETGSFVAGTDQSNITLSVTALHTNVVIWDSTVKGDDNLSTAPYGTKKMIFLYADGNTGFRSYGGIDTNGTAFYSNGAFGGIGRWGNNTSWNDRVEFTSSTIKFINPRINGQGFYLIDGHTYNWRAW